MRGSKETKMVTVHRFMVLGLLFLFGGCAVKKVPPTHSYLLAPSTPSIAKHSANPRLDSLRILVAHPTRISESTAIYYLDDRYRQQPYSYSRWYDTVATMFEGKLLRAIERSGIAKNVAGRSSAAKTRLLLEVAILDFVHDCSGVEPSKGRAVLLASLIWSRNGKTVASRLFEAETDAPQRSAAGGVAALNEASDTIVADLIEWLERVELQNTP